MDRRFLFGPVTPSFAEQNLRRFVEAGTGIVFPHDGPASVGPFDTWDDVASRLPSGWRPDFLVLHLQYNTIPAVLWNAPIPIVGLAGDYNLLWHHYRHVLPLCDLVLTDARGVARLAQAGITHARAAQLYGCERAFVEFDYGAGPRDIDVLFVGNFNPAVQGERLPWLGRIARLKKRWNVYLTTHVFGDDYRRLLGRAKIAFNRGIRGEWNNRASEAIAAGALLFQEAENEEVARILCPGEEYVPYADRNLEELLEYYLEHDTERRAIVARATQRRHELTYEAFWSEALATIGDAWPELRERLDKRRGRTRCLNLHGRAWQLVSSTSGEDATLVADLNESVDQRPRSAELQHALGVALWSRTPRDVERSAAAFQAAWQSDPRHVVAGLNLAELLALLGDKEHAIEQAQRVLAILDSAPALPDAAFDAVRVPTEFDFFRVEWERAAWQATGPDDEQQAKRQLLRWRLHELLAQLTGDVVHHFQAMSARPDMPPTLLQLGTALGRQQRPAEALTYVRQALAVNPFDPHAAQAYHHTLGLLGRSTEQLRFAAEQRLLSAAAPTLLPPAAWCADLAVPTTIPTSKPATVHRIAWHGVQTALHSLALVNREICRRLVERGHEVSLIEPEVPLAASARAPLDSVLQERLGQTLSGTVDVHVGHQWPPDFTPPVDGHWVVIQPWEFGSIPRAWMAPMTQLIDEIWVPSHYVRNSFVVSGIPADRVQVVPNGVASIFFERHEPCPLQTTKRFKFLFVGGTIARKGIDILLRAYEQCFSAADDVCLVIKDMGVGTFYQGQTAEQLLADLRSRPHAPEVEYHAEELSMADMARLYAACDCLIHPYRGEGFGLPIAEALASGLPVIATGFGAALDFCRDEHAYLIPARAEFLDRGQGAFETVSEQYWARPDFDLLRYLMRHVLEHPEEARGKALAGREFIERHFTWDHAVAAVEERLQQLRSRPIRRLHQALPVPNVTLRSTEERPRVSLTMIVKNEERNLAECLRCIVDLVDEVVIADTGSTDRTKEIARESGAKLVDFPWIDSFAAARNEALRHASGAWIFWMDADDRIDAVNRARLRELFARLSHGQVVGYNMKVSCVPGPESDLPTVVDHIRLFPNLPQLRWKYRIHEQILGSIRNAQGTVAWTDVVIQHVGYQDADMHRRKGERNFRLLQLDYQDDPNDPFTLFNLGNMLHEYRQLPNAIDMLTQSLRLSAPTDSIVRKLYSLIAQCQQGLGQHDAALATLREGRGHYPNDVELLFVESAVRKELGDVAGAIACLELVRHSYDDNHFGSVNTALRGPGACNNLALLYQQAGRPEEAEQQWKEAVAAAPKYLPAWLNLADLYLQQQRFPDLQRLIERLGEMPHAQLETAILQAQAHLAQRQFDAARTIIGQVIQQAPASVFARLILARVFLQEGRDLQAAETALRDVLVLDPTHAEARRNLEVLLKGQ